MTVVDVPHMELMDGIGRANGREGIDLTSRCLMYRNPSIQEFCKSDEGPFIPPRAVSGHVPKISFGDPSVLTSNESCHEEVF